MLLSIVDAADFELWNDIFSHFPNIHTKRENQLWRQLLTNAKQTFLYIQQFIYTFKYVLNNNTTKYLYMYIFMYILCLINKYTHFYKYKYTYTHTHTCVNTYMHTVAETLINSWHLRLF